MEWRKHKNELFNAVYFLKGDGRKATICYTPSLTEEGCDENIKTRDQALRVAAERLFDSEDGIVRVDKVKTGWMIYGNRLPTMAYLAGLVASYIKKVKAGVIIEAYSISNAEWFPIHTNSRLKSIVDVYEEVMGYKCEVCFVRKRGLEIARNVLTMIIGARGLSFDYRNPSRKAFILSMIRCIRDKGMWSFYAIRASDLCDTPERYIVTSHFVVDELVSPMRGYLYEDQDDALMHQTESELSKFLRGEIQ